MKQRGQKLISITEKSFGRFTYNLVFFRIEIWKLWRRWVEATQIRLSSLDSLMIVRIDFPSLWFVEKQYEDITKTSTINDQRVFMMTSRFGRKVDLSQRKCGPRMASTRLRLSHSAQFANVKIHDPARARPNWDLSLGYTIHTRATQLRPLRRRARGAVNFSLVRTYGSY